VSLDGGAEPNWSPTTGEIFFRNRDDVMAAAVQTRTGFEVTGRTKLFTGVYERARFKDHNFGAAGEPARRRAS